MKKVTVSIMAILAVAALSMSAFAANKGIDTMSSSRQMNERVLPNATLADVDGNGAFPNYSMSHERVSVSDNRLENATLADVDGSGIYPRSGMSDEHYGIAPAWQFPEPSNDAQRLHNPSLLPINSKFNDL